MCAVRRRRWHSAAPVDRCSFSTRRLPADSDRKSSLDLFLFLYYLLEAAASSKVFGDDYCANYLPKAKLPTAL